MRPRIFFTLVICVLTLGSMPVFSASIALRPHATWTEQAAAGDLQRAIFASTGKMLPIGPFKRNDRDVIAIGFAPMGGIDFSVKRLGDQGFMLKTMTCAGKTIIVAAGANPVSTSYAAYTLAERYGAGFYLGGDALPTNRTQFTIPKLDLTKKPVFKIRGVLPWYNFFDSPTAWNIEDYRLFIDQLAKSKNNFLGFHSYDYEPFCAYRDAKGELVDGAPLVSTLNPTWGTASMKITDFAPGAQGYFDKPYFGADCSMGYKTREEGITNAQKLLAEALWYAKARGVKTCVGFEVSGDPTTPGDLDRLEQRLRAVLKAYPMLDYVWIWEPEAMAIRGIDPRGIRTDFGGYYRRWEKAFSYLDEPGRRTEAVRVGIYALAAHRIISKEAPRVRMILSAWGGDNHCHFTDFYPGYDKILPKDIIFSALDNIITSDTVSAAYGKLSKDREFWPIPWFEYDGDQWCPQPNTKHFYNAARDSLKKGASGLLAIHWRTRDVEESHAYISQFAWNPKLAYDDFYTEYAKKAYGDEKAAKLLMDLQELGFRWLGGGGQMECGGFEWNRAPDRATDTMGAVFAKYSSLQQSEWLDDLKYMQVWLDSYEQTAWILRSDGAIRTLLRQLKAEGRKPTSEEIALIDKDLIQARTSLTTAIAAAARRVSDRGELGILATINTKAWASLLEIEKQAEEIAGVHARDFNVNTVGPLAVKSVLRSGTAFVGQPFRISAVVHSAQPGAQAEVLYRTPGKQFQSAPLKFTASSLLEGQIPISSVGLIEYYIRVKDAQGNAVWPLNGAKAPACVSVVLPSPIGTTSPQSDTCTSAASNKALATTVSGPMLVQVSWPEYPKTRVFQVMRSADGSDWSQLVVVRDNWYEDRALAVGSAYRYRVYDADIGRLLAESTKVVVAMPPLPKAPELNVNPGVSRVRLSWKADDPTALSYTVYSAETADGPFTALMDVGPQSEAQSIRTCIARVAPGKKLFYAIRAVSLDGRDGPLSAPVSAAAYEVGAKPIVNLNFDGSDTTKIESLVVEQGIPAIRTGASSFVQLEHQDIYNTGGEITISFWVKLRTSGIIPVFISHGSYSLDGYFVQQFNDKIRFHLAGLGDLDAGHIDLNRWTAVTATYDGAEMVLYVNGEKVGSRNAAGPIRPAVRPLYIGRYELQSKDFEVDGWMSRTRIYGYALSSDRVMTQYQSFHAQ